MELGNPTAHGTRIIDKINNQTVPTTISFLHTLAVK